jgi:hypothetical protein
MIAILIDCFILSLIPTTFVAFRDKGAHPLGQQHRDLNTKLFRK